MKFLAILGLCVAAAGVGAGTVFVADKIYWDNELKVQIAGKDKMLADLEADRTALRSDMDTLQRLNTEMRAGIVSAMSKASAVVKNAKSAQERLEGVLTQLLVLQAAIEKWEQP